MANGTPGTGKKSISPLVATGLGIQALSLNDYAMNHGLATKVKGDLVVDTRRVRASLVRHQKGPCVVYGHLLHEVLGPSEVSRVFVLRCEPGELKTRLEARGYRGDKLRENLEAELIGVLQSLVLAEYGQQRVIEVDTTRSKPTQAANVILGFISSPLTSQTGIDWTRSYTSAAKLRSLLAVETTGPAFI